MWKKGVLAVFVLFLVVIGAEAYTTQYQSYDVIDESGTTTMLWVGPRYWNGTWLPIDTTVKTGSFNGYSHAVEKGIYQMYYKEYVSYGDAVKYCRDGWCFTSQPSKVTYRNPTGSNDDIYSSPNSSIVGSSVDNIFRWVDIFGNIDLEYEYDKTELKEKLILNEKPREPNTYLGNISLVTLDFDNYIKYPVGVEMYVDGSKVISDMVVSGAIELRNSTDLLYTLPKPVAYDSNGASIDLQYQIVFDGKYNTNKQRLMWFYIKTPYTWLNSTERIYPVFIDPDLTVNSATTLCGVQNYDNVWINATVTICAYNGTAPSGTLTFNAVNFNITSNGMINGTGKGYRGATSSYASGEGPGGGIGVSYIGGQGGGGYGGYGGNGTGTAYTNGAYGGAPYGSINNVTSMGSGGASTSVGGGGYGGNGGGYIFINTTGTTNLEGTINMGGNKGGYYDGSNGGSGGSGGGINIITSELKGTSTIQSTGGEGGGQYNSAGGGGGRILILFCINSSNITASVDGGYGLLSNSGLSGTINISFTPSLCGAANITNPYLNASTISADDTIRLNVSVTYAAGNDFVDLVWAEFLYPNTSLVNMSMSKYTLPGCAVNGTLDTCTECSYAGCVNCPGCSQSSAWTDIILEDFDEATSDLATNWDEGDWTAQTSTTYCINDDDDDCVRSSTSDTTINYSTALDMSKCIANSIYISGRFYDYGVDSGELLNLYVYNVSDTSWKTTLVNDGGSQSNSAVFFNISIGGGTSFSNSGFKFGFDTYSTDSSEYYYLDDVRVSCTKEECIGTLNCSSITNETGCNSCGVCNWTQVWQEPTWYVDFTDTSATGTYNVTNIYSNDTVGQRSSISPTLGWVVLNAASIYGINISDIVSISEQKQSLLLIKRRGSDTYAVREANDPTSNYDRLTTDTAATKEATVMWGGYSRLSVGIFSLSDMLVKRWGTTRLGQDSISFADVVARLLYKNVAVADTATIMEQMSRVGTFQRSASDTISINEVETALRGFSLRGEDTISIGELLDTLGVFRPAAADTITVKENEQDLFMLFRVSQDTINVNDLLAFFRTYPRRGSDTISVAELLDVLYSRYRTGQDSLLFSESATRRGVFGKWAADNIVINEAIKRSAGFFRRLAELLGLADNAGYTFTEGIHTWVRIDPTIPVDSDDLLGYCNATFPSGENITYSWKWWNDSSLYSSGNKIVINTSSVWCYQESANVSTICGGLNTGKYFWTGTWLGNKAIDGDWGTSAYFFGGVYINYTKPILAQSNSRWQTRIGNDANGQTTQNVSIAPACWNQTKLMFKILLSYNETTNSSVNGITGCFCYNGTNWHNLDIEVIPPAAGYYPYEEAMWWNLSNTSTKTSYFLSGTELNLANISAAETSVGDVWTFSCMASNGTVNGTWTNASVSLANSYSFSLSDLISLAELRLRQASFSRNLANALNFKEGYIRLGIFGRQGAVQLTIYDIGSRQSHLFIGNLQESMTFGELASQLYHIKRTSGDSITFQELLSRLGVFQKPTSDTFGFGEILNRLIGRRGATDSITFVDDMYSQGAFTRRSTDTISISELLDLMFSLNKNVDDTITIHELLWKAGYLNIETYDTFTMQDAAVFDNLKRVLRDIGDGLVFRDAINTLSYYIRYNIQGISIGDGFDITSGWFVHASDTPALLEGVVAFKGVSRQGFDVFGVIDTASSTTTTVVVVVPVGGGGGSTRIVIPTMAGVLGVAMDSQLSAYWVWMRQYSLWLLTSLMCLILLVYAIVRIRYERLRKKYKKEVKKG